MKGFRFLIKLALSLSLSGTVISLKFGDQRRDERSYLVQFLTNQKKGSPHKPRSKIIESPRKQYHKSNLKSFVTMENGRPWRMQSRTIRQSQNSKKITSNSKIQVSHDIIQIQKASRSLAQKLNTQHPEGAHINQEAFNRHMKSLHQDFLSLTNQVNKRFLKQKGILSKQYQAKVRSKKERNIVWLSDSKKRSIIDPLYNKFLKKIRKNDNLSYRGSEKNQFKFQLDVELKQKLLKSIKKNGDRENDYTDQCLVFNYCFNYRLCRFKSLFNSAREPLEKSKRVSRDLAKERICDLLERKNYLEFFRKNQCFDQLSRKGDELLGLIDKYRSIKVDLERSSRKLKNNPNIKKKRDSIRLKLETKFEEFEDILRRVCYKNLQRGLKQITVKNRLCFSSIYSILSRLEFFSGNPIKSNIFKSFDYLSLTLNPYNWGRALKACNFNCPLRLAGQKFTRQALKKTTTEKEAPTGCFEGENTIFNIDGTYSCEPLICKVGTPVCSKRDQKSKRTLYYCYTRKNCPKHQNLVNEGTCRERCTHVECETGQNFEYRMNKSGDWECKCRFGFNERGDRCDRLHCGGQIKAYSPSKDKFFCSASAPRCKTNEIQVIGLDSDYGCQCKQGSVLDYFEKDRVDCDCPGDLSPQTQKDKKITCGCPLHLVRNGIYCDCPGHTTKFSKPDGSVGCRCVGPNPGEKQINPSECYCGIGLIAYADEQPRCKCLHRKVIAGAKIFCCLEGQSPSSALDMCLDHTSEPLRSLIEKGSKVKSLKQFGDNFDPFSLRGSACFE